MGEKSIYLLLQGYTKLLGALIKKGYPKEACKTGRLHNCFITLLKRFKLGGPKRLDYQLINLTTS